MRKTRRNVKRDGRKEIDRARRREEGKSQMETRKMEGRARGMESDKASMKREAERDERRERKDGG